MHNRTIYHLTDVKTGEAIPILTLEGCKRRIKQMGYFSLCGSHLKIMGNM